jgi:hypothetical protein
MGAKHINLAKYAYFNPIVTANINQNQRKTPSNPLIVRRGEEGGSSNYKDL